MAKYTTHVCKTENLKCANCGKPILVDAEFAVLTTPSRPYENNCLKCADERIAVHGLMIVDQRPGKNPGTQRQ